MVNEELTKTIHIGQEDFAEHDIVISLFNPAKPIFIKEREQQAKADGLEYLIGKTTDCSLYIRGYAGYDAFPVTEAFFSEGQFLWATGDYTFGQGCIPINGRHITDLSDFKAFLEKYFTVGQKRISSKQFAGFISDSNLSKQFTSAVQDLISQ